MAAAYIHRRKRLASPVVLTLFETEEENKTKARNKRLC